MTNIGIGLALLAAQVTGVQLPDPAIFGKPTSEAVKLLVDKNPGDAEPFVVWSDVSCGRYFAASAFYRPSVSPAVVKAAIAKVYGKERIPPSGKTDERFGMWRVESQGFSVQMAVEGKGSTNEGTIVVRYIHFMSPDAMAMVIPEAFGKKRKDIERLAREQGIEEPCAFNEEKAK
jgi:hypothetical protein